MTKKPLVLAKPYFDGLNWHRSVGDAFDTSGLHDAVVTKLQAKGFLLTPAAYQAHVNPEAALAQAAADQSADALTRVLAVFPDARTAEDVITAVHDLRQQVPTPEATSEAAAHATLARGLQALYPAHAPGDLLAAVQAARDLAADARALRAVHATPGEPLPPNFKGRGPLGKLGLDTWESLRGKTPAQLSAVEGVTDEQAREIAARVEAHFTPA